MADDQGICIVENCVFRDNADQVIFDRGEVTMIDCYCDKILTVTRATFSADQTHVGDFELSVSLCSPNKVNAAGHGGCGNPCPTDPFTISLVFFNSDAFSASMTNEFSASPIFTGSRGVFSPSNGISGSNIASASMKVSESKQLTGTNVLSRSGNMPKSNVLDRTSSHSPSQNAFSVTENFDESDHFVQTKSHSLSHVISKSRVLAETSRITGTAAIPSNTFTASQVFSPGLPLEGDADEGSLSLLWTGIPIVLLVALCAAGIYLVLRRRRKPAAEKEEPVQKEDSDSACAVREE
jgi:hypothetical protein